MPPQFCGAAVVMVRESVVDEVCWAAVVPMIGLAALVAGVHSTAVEAVPTPAAVTGATTK
jgi:hypothetical protein